MINDLTRVPVLPVGLHTNIKVIVSRTSYGVTFAVMDGKLFVVSKRHGYFNFLAQASKTAVIEVARLLDMKLSDLKKMQDAHRAQEKADAEADHFDEIERGARQLGYKLVKEKKS